ncbi:hypothetical protein NQ315_003093 [Exocentrus adspersus]|uniref:Dihydrolipoamide acetyltransferase component of pyruvate dehydrogenase complex n=1 Tax=Exocentrus adspersus TaxID=1586481 RepID=A0AAV8W4H5_9CUCU|nr:hypothetical protein NQ315_003093 [Exocentrus adspersus]
MEPHTTRYLRVLSCICCRSLSPLEMCTKLNFFTIRSDIVPLPEAGAPRIKPLNIFVAMLVPFSTYDNLARRAAFVNMPFAFKQIIRACGTFRNNRAWITSKNINGHLPTSARDLHTSFNLAARVAFTLADIGEGIKEVHIKEWYVKVGDQVRQFDNICEVQSDKASVTITSRYDGTVSKLYYNVDDVALVGKPLVDIETDKAEEQQPEASSTEEQTARNEDLEVAQEQVVKSEDNTLEHADLPTDVSEQQILLCIPSVRRLAKELKVNLSEIKGTGKNGRILKEDVLNYINSKSAEEPTPSPESPEDTIEPIKGFQKVMVKTMTDSSKIPMFVYGDEIKVTKLSEIRRSLKDLPELAELKLSFMPFFIKAVSNALHRYPVVNSSVDEQCENIIYHKSHNIGIAMDTKVGLAVPVIKGVEGLGIVEITQELNRLIEIGREGNFQPNDMVGGTFAISNIGAIGGSYMKPLILPPQVAIIALGASQVLPRFDANKNLIAEEIVNISAAADHRIIDGATMARFTQALKKQIENPYLLFLNL